MKMKRTYAEKLNSSHQKLLIDNVTWDEAGKIFHDVK